MSIDSDRQNALLCLAYQSKLMGLAGIGGYRRAVNTFADGFTTITGIDAVQSSNYMFDNIDGVIAPTPGGGTNLSTSATAIAGAMAPVSGSAGQTADGNTSPSLNGWVSGETSGGVSGVSYVGQLFTTSRQIRQIVLWQGYNGDVDKCISSALVQYSDNGTSWTTQSTAALPHSLAPQALPLAASGLHPGWRLLANSAPGISNRWGVTELQMMETIGGANMTLVTVAQPADAAIGNGRVLLEIDNSAAPVLNTDLTVEVTCDGGTNWALAILAMVSSSSQSGRTVVETNDQPCVAGTSFAARVKTLNGKNILIHALTITAH